MKILFCSASPLDTHLGVGKVTVELMEELRALGWDCTGIPPSAMGQPDHGEKSIPYSRALRTYLHQHAGEYDVVEYDSGHLPYARSEFSSNTLMVARVALLAHHFVSIDIPRGFKENLSYWIRGTTTRRVSQANCRSAHTTLQQADLINLGNDDDRRELLRWWIPQEKIMVVPYGLRSSRRALFDAVPSDPPGDPVIAFVGTFDSRKGAQDFPGIVRSILEGEPRARFQLFGTGPSRTPDYVKGFFPPAHRDRIQVTPQFQPDELPQLLAGCSVGIFPSYIESFGFGVLEMLAASIPVVAYQAPGPATLLAPEYLVRAGDVGAMAGKVLHLLQNRSALVEARQWARKRSHDFSFTDTARKTSEAYAHHLEMKRHPAAAAALKS